MSSSAPSSNHPASSASISPVNPTVPLDGIYDMDHYGGYLESQINVLMASGPGSMMGPITPPVEEPQRQPHFSHQPIPMLRKIPESVKRRSQNREAQRRFRERREKQQKSLQQEADGLRSECETLRKQQTECSIEIIKLRKDNDKLQTEVRNLRQQQRLVLRVLERVRDSQSSSAMGDAYAHLFDLLQCYLEESGKIEPETP
ncbi:hypothetical protein BJX96DRAFT_148510 [Aspergillus floccosus]